MILHIDMDAFYASVEQRDDPKLAGLPIAVGGSPRGRGVISAANYEARKYGIHSAMPASQAIRLCPKLVFIKPRMDHYAAISKQIRQIFSRFTSLVEPLSLDEAFLDVTGCERLFGPAVEIALQIKSSILDEVGLVASAGVAPNKYLAKVASDLEKPDGMVVVDPGSVLEFLEPLPINRIWGIGKQGTKKFHSLGVQTIGQLRNLPMDTLRRAFGVNCEHFWRLARGIDSRKVVSDRDAKTISHETTFPADISDREILNAWLLELTGQVARRLRRYDFRCKTVQLKLRFSNFRTITRSKSVHERTNVTDEIWQVAQDLLWKELPETHEPVRLIGIGVSNLSTAALVQGNLFDGEKHSRNQRIDKTTDKIRDLFGTTSVRPATSLEQQIRHRPPPKPDDA